MHLIYFIYCHYSLNLNFSGNIMTTPTTTPDIIIVGETPPRTSVANQKRTPPAPHSAPLRQLPPALLQPPAPLPPPLMMPANPQLVAASNAGGMEGMI